MSRSIHPPRGLWIAGIGLVLIVVVVICVLLVAHNQSSTSPTALETSKPSMVVPSVRPTTEPAVAVVETSPPLPRVDFLPGSVEEACGLNELPPYWVADGSLERNTDHTNAFESEECQIALETHMNAVNPYHFFWNAPEDTAMVFHLTKFVVLKDPLTFGRVFADPTGDSARVQDALSRPECLLQGDETNWELKETCHAEAFLNYALINDLCFGGGINRRSKAYYAPDDNPTPEQDRLMWKQDFEDAWVSAQCEDLDPELQLTSQQHPTLFELVGPIQEWDSEERKAAAFLVELAARLGDDTAGLTQSISWPGFPPGDGYKYGRFSKLFPSGEWGSLKEVGAMMRMYRPSDEPTELFLKAFRFLALMDARRPDPRDEMQFDWEWVVQHVCVSVVLPRSTAEARGVDEPTEIRSCKEIVHELRQRDLKFAPLLNALDKFEQVAIELGVYE